MTKLLTERTLSIDCDGNLGRSSGEKEKDCLANVKDSVTSMSLLLK